jgi:porphobilinogen synthase
VDERKIVLESLMCFRRAGANIILTYFAKEAAQWMREDEERRRELA